MKNLLYSVLTIMIVVNCFGTNVSANTTKTMYEEVFKKNILPVYYIINNLKLKEIPDKIMVNERNVEAIDNLLQKYYFPRCNDNNSDELYYFYYFLINEDNIIHKGIIPYHLINDVNAEYTIKMSKNDWILFSFPQSFAEYRQFSVVNDTKQLYEIDSTMIDCPIKLAYQLPADFGTSIRYNQYFSVQEARIYEVFLTWVNSSKNSANIEMYEYYLEKNTIPKMQINIVVD